MYKTSDKGEYFATKGKRRFLYMDSFSKVTVILGLIAAILTAGYVGWFLVGYAGVSDGHEVSVRPGPQVSVEPEPPVPVEPEPPVPVEPELPVPVEPELPVPVEPELPGAVEPEPPVPAAPDMAPTGEHPFFSGGRGSRVVTNVVLMACIVIAFFWTLLVTLYGKNEKRVERADEINKMLLGFLLASGKSLLGLP